jgi:hypothetical protein
VSSVTFRSWRRSGVYEMAGATRVGGRLQGTLELVLENRGDAADKASGSTTFEIMGPRDAGGLLPGAVLRTTPPPDATRVETTRCVHVDFADPDLPWRYTPEPAAGAVLRPWLVLVVGSTQEMILQPGDQVSLAPSVLQAHPLARSARWAHVQEDGASAVSRLLAVRALTKDTDYIAALVPAFNDDAGDRWSATANAPLVVPCLYSWRFRTGEEGDFTTLATALEPGEAAPGVGSAELRFERGAVAATLSVRGALGPGGTDPAAPTGVTSAMQGLRLPASDPQGRRVIGLPTFGEAWGTAAPTATWLTKLNEDPRPRGVAGLGVQAGIDLQEMIVEAAVAQLGAIEIAAQRLRQLGAGLAAGGALWRRRLPKEPAEQLAIFGPSLRRIATDQGTVARRLAAPGRPLHQAVFSSAARRVLRPGTARARLAQPGAAFPGKVLTAANRCPPAPRRSHPGLPHLDLAEAALGLSSIESGIEIAIAEGGLPGRVPPDLDTIRPPPDPESLIALVRGLRLKPPRRRCAAPELPRVAASVADAIDPTLDDAPARGRVLAGLTGIDASLAPPEACVDLDFPSWQYLRDAAPEWLLPGAGDVENDQVVALGTNPAFVDAFLVGLNTQVQNELRFRNVRIGARCTPFKRFWGRTSAAGTPADDIVGVEDWTNGSELGSAQHQTQEAKGEDLVLIMRTELFRRYPSTLLYVTPAVLDNAGAPKWDTDPTFATREFPAFQGRLGDGTLLFGFALDLPETVKHWVVLEEPPPGFGFLNAPDSGWPLARRDAFLNGTDGATFADAAFDDPYRVLIRGDSLVRVPGP